jgi:hypothetical protein
MRRFLLATALLMTAGMGAGCMNAARIGCEFKSLYLDVQRNLFGIDYPHGAPEFQRDKYIGLSDPGNQPLCDD